MPLDIPAPTSDPQQGAANLDRYGFTIHPDFLTPAQRSALLDRVTEQAELEREEGVAVTGTCLEDSRTGRPDGDRPPPWQIVNFLPNKGRVFLELMAHPLALSYARQVFRGVPFNLVNQAALIVGKGSPQQVLHADQQALPFATPIPVMLNVFVCLSDFEAAMGATRLVPGSHRGPAPEIRRDPDGLAQAAVPDTLVAAEAKAGAAIIWESRTWHCQGASTSDKVRWSVSSVYGAHFMKPQCNWPALIEDDVYATLSDAERQLLAFEVAYNYAGRLTPRSPDDPRANTNCFFPYVPQLRRGGDKHAVADPRVAQARTRALPTRLD